MRSEMQIKLGRQRLEFQAKLPQKGLVRFLGDEGSGKTSSMLAFLGFRRFKGRAQLAGETYDIHCWRKIAALRRSASYIDPSYDPAYRDLDLSALLEYSEPSCRLLIERLTRSFDIYLYAIYDTLSEGEMAIFNFLAGLTKDPKIIFIDEIFSSLDRKRQALLVGVLAELAQDRLIVVTHLDEVELEYDQIVRFEAGTAQMVGTVDRRADSSVQKFNPHRRTPKASFKTRIGVKTWFRWLQLGFGILTAFSALIPFAGLFSRYQEAIASNRRTVSSGRLGNLTCYGRSDNCHFETYFFLKGIKVDFILGQSRGSLPTAILKQFPGKDEESRLTAANTFFLSYFDLEFTRSGNSVADDWTISVDREQLKAIQSRVTSDGLYLVPDLSDLSEDQSLILPSGQDLKAAQADPYGMIYDLHRSIFSPKENIFTVYGGLRTPQSEGLLYLAHVHHLALTEYQDRGGFCNLTGLEGSEQEHTIVHNIARPQQYAKYFPELKEAQLRFYLALSASLSLIVAVTIATSLLTRSHPCLDGRLALALRQKTAAQLAGECYLKDLLVDDCAILLSLVVVGLGLRSVISPWCLLLGLALLFALAAVKFAACCWEIKRSRNRY